MDKMTPDTTDFNSLSKKQLVELVIAKYNDCFRLEEENKKLRDYADNLDSENDNQAIEIEELKKENKKLKDSIIILEKGGQVVFTLEKRIDELLEENEKLKKECEENDYLVEDNARWMKKCGEKTMEIKKLKSDLAYERTMLDNVRAEYKSLQNINKKLREELSAYDREYFDEDKKAKNIYKD